MERETEVARYRLLPYRRVIERVSDESGTYYVCSYPALPGLFADGETPAHARRNAALAFDDYISAQLEWGVDIPRPRGADRVETALDQWRVAEATGQTKPVEMPEDRAGGSARQVIEHKGEQSTAADKPETLANSRVAAREPVPA